MQAIERAHGRTAWAATRPDALALEPGPLSELNAPTVRPRESAPRGQEHRCCFSWVPAFAGTNG